jgi:hypothetical protein
MMQKCVIFNKEMNRERDNMMYKISDNKDYNKALTLVEEWDYNSKKGKIPVGILYQSKEQVFEDKWPQLN